MNGREQMGGSWVTRGVEFVQAAVGGLRKDVLSILDFNHDFKDLVCALEPGYKVNNDLYFQDARIKRFQSGSSNYSKEDFINATVRDSHAIGKGVDKYLEGHSKGGIGKTIAQIGDCSVEKSQLQRLHPDSKAYSRVETVIALAHGSARLNSLLNDGENGIPAAYAAATVEARTALRLIDEAAKLAYNWESGWGAVTPDSALSRAKSRINASDVRKAMGAFSFALVSCMSPVDQNGMLTQLPEVVTQAAATEQALPGVDQTPSPDQTERAKTAIFENIGGEELAKMVADFEAKPTTYYDQSGKVVVEDVADESIFTLNAGLKFKLEGGKTIVRGFVTGPGGVNYLASLSEDGKSWDLNTALPAAQNGQGHTFYGQGFYRNALTGEYPVPAGGNAFPMPAFSREVGPDGELIQDWVIDLNAKDEAEWFKITLPVGASKSAMPVELGGNALLQAQELMKETEYAETYNTVWMVNPDGTRTLALSTDGTVAGVAFTRDENNTKWLTYPRYTAEQIHTMTPEQLMAVVPEMDGYEKQYQGLYVHYVNELAQLGGSYNLETGDRLTMPENLRTLDKLPTKIENADSYPEVDVKDLPAFVAWLHYKYDAQAKDLKPYPFVEKEYTSEAKRSVDLRGWGVFFSTVESMDRYAFFPGMVKIMDGNDPIFWGFPRLIKDNSGNSRALLASDAWDVMLADPSMVNSFYYRLTSNPALRDKWQIAKFSDNKELACEGYQKVSPTYDARYEMCNLYLKKYYNSVEWEVARIIATGIYSQKLETVPVFMVEDTTTFHIGQ